MTILAPTHPLTIKLSDELTKRLLALQYETDEVVLSCRIIVRNGVPRKVKWTREEESCFN